MATGQTPDPAWWRLDQARLKFMLGEYPLWVWRFRALTTGAHFLSLSPRLAQTPPRAEMAARGAAVAALVSCPVDQPPPRLRWADGCLGYAPSVYQHYMVDLGGGFAGWLAGFKAKTRATLQRKVRKYQERFPARPVLEVCDRPEQVAGFLGRAKDIARLTYQERLLGRVLPTDPGFRAELEAQVAGGLARGYLLWADERPAAFVLGPVLGQGAFLYDYVGYDPELANWSPGGVLQYLIVEHLCQEGRLRWYDLCVGEGEHKRQLANHQVLCADIYWFRPRPLGLTLALAHWAWAGGMRAAVRLSDRLGLKQRLKRLLRSRAAA